MLRKELEKIKHKKGCKKAYINQYVKLVIQSRYRDNPI